jgi:two-component system OmpR family response regulator
VKGGPRQPPRVLIVEDDSSIRSAVVVALLREGYQVRAKSDATGIADVANDFRPDMAILDVRLPVGPDGYAAARILRLDFELAILFLTAADGIEARLAGFRAGGDDYLEKPFSMAELLARAQALLRRSGRLSTAPRQFEDLLVDENTRTATRAGVVLDLTRREFDLLVALTREPGHVLSKVQLLNMVWGFDDHISNVVEVNVSTLRRKLEEHGPRVIQNLRGVGYVLRPARQRTPDKA